MVRFEMDQRGMEKAMRQAAAEHVRRSQPAIDRFCARHSGHPATEVRPALERQMRELGLDVPRKDLDQYARLVSDGGKIILKA